MIEVMNDPDLIRYLPQQTDPRRRRRRRTWTSLATWLVPAVIWLLGMWMVVAVIAAQLAVSNPDAADEYMTEQERCEEYLDQLSTGDATCLRSWIGWEIESGCREAVQILKMWIRAELPLSVSAGGERG